MRTLQFSVDGQKLIKENDFSNIIRGSKGYLDCRFTFNTADWSGRKIIALFENGGEEFAMAVNADRSCGVPNEVTDSSFFRIKLVGVGADGSQIITNKILVEQEG